MIKQKICKKKYCRGIEQVREAKSSRKKKDKAVSLLENGSEKNTRAVGSRARLSQSYTKLVLVSRKPLLFSILTNPINKTFMRLIHLINSTFLSLKIIVTQSYTKLVLVSRKPLLFSILTNPINKTFMRLIHLINSTFLSLKIIVDTLIDIGNCKTSNIKINTTLFSDANAPVRFRAQQRAKYSSLQLTANCIAAKRCLRHYFKLI